MLTVSLKKYELLRDTHKALLYHTFLFLFEPLVKHWLNSEHIFLVSDILVKFFTYESFYDSGAGYEAA